MFTTTTIRLLCSMLAMSMLCSVVGQDSDSFWEEAGTQSPMDDNSKDERNVGVTDPPVQLCGRIKVHIPGSGGRKKRFDNNEEWDDLDKIAGSPFATYGEIPWMVKILDNGTYVCGGAIINDYWVVTAASCVTDFGNYRQGPYTLVVGDYSLSGDDAGEQTFEISLIERHHDYNAQLGWDNIALLRVKPNCNHGIIFNNYVQPVCLPLLSETTSDGELLTIAAWASKTAFYQVTATSHLLRKAKIPVVDRERCDECLKCTVCVRRTGLQHDIICGGAGSGGTIVDYQNAGGPATSRNGEMHILRAIIRGSTGYSGPCNINMFLTSIEKHLYWIAVVIQYSSNDDQKIIPPRTA